MRFLEKGGGGQLPPWQTSVFFRVAGYHVDGEDPTLEQRIPSEDVLTLFTIGAV